MNIKPVHVELQDLPLYGCCFLALCLLASLVMEGLR